MPCAPRLPEQARESRVRRRRVSRSTCINPMSAAIDRVKATKTAMKINSVIPLPLEPVIGSAAREVWAIPGRNKPPAHIRPGAAGINVKAKDVLKRDGITGKAGDFRDRVDPAATVSHATDLNDEVHRIDKLTPDNADPRHKPSQGGHVFNAGQGFSCRVGVKCTHRPVVT